MTDCVARRVLAAFGFAASGVEGMEVGVVYRWLAEEPVFLALGAVQTQMVADGLWHASCVPVVWPCRGLH